LRFSNKFTFEIRTAEDIDPDNNLIPPCYSAHVENAILHGIKSKAGDGKFPYLSLNKTTIFLRSNG